MITFICDSREKRFNWLSFHRSALINCSWPHRKSSPTYLRWGKKKKIVTAEKTLITSSHRQRRNEKRVGIPCRWHWPKTIEIDRIDMHALNMYYFKHCHQFGSHIWVAWYYNFCTVHCYDTSECGIHSGSGIRQHHFVIFCWQPKRHRICTYICIGDHCHAPMIEWIRAAACSFGVYNGVEFDYYKLRNNDWMCAQGKEYERGP